MKIRVLIPAAMAAFAAGSAQAYESDYCREFTKTIYVGGRAQNGYGTSCLMPDGSWQITQEPQPRYAQPANYVQPVTYVQQPVTYVESVRYVRPRPYYSPFLFSFHYSNWGRDWNHRDNRRWDNHRGNGRHDNDRRGGRGHH